MIKRTAYLKRSIKPISRKRQKPRRGPLRDPGYLAFLREEGKCVVCYNALPSLGTSTLGMCDPAHGRVNGRGSKGPDNEAGPLCRPHHDEQTALGWEKFEECYMIDWKIEAAAWYKLYQIWKETTGVCE